MQTPLESLEGLFIIQLKDMITALKDINQIEFINNNYDIIKIGIDLNKHKIIRGFIKEILPYSNKIYDRDYNFFLNFDFNNKYKNLNNNINKSCNSDISIDRIFQFKDSWNKLTEYNKNIIIDYMIILCRIADKYRITFDKL